MNFNLFKYSLLTKLAEFVLSLTEEETKEMNSFDAWFEKFLTFMDYEVED